MNIENQIPSFMEKTIRENYSPLPRAEENALIQLYKDGNHKALARLINAQMKCIIAIAKKYQDRNSPIEDCIQQATLTFPNAIMEFDPTMGNRFFTFVALKIRATIQAYVFQNDIVRMPMNKVKATLSKKDKLVVEKKPQRTEMISMSTPTQDNSATLEDTFVDTSIEDIEKNRSINAQLDRYLSAFDKTSKRWKMFEMLHGLDGNGVKTMEDVAKSFGCSKQLVGITCLKMMRSLRKAVPV